MARSAEHHRIIGVAGAFVLAFGGFAAAGPAAAAAPEPVDASFIPIGTPTTVVDSLDVPWSIVPLDDGTVLISERETAKVLEISTSGARREIGVVPGVDSSDSGEGGLLGLAVHEAQGSTWLYAMHSTSNDNRIVRMLLSGAAGDFSFGSPDVLLSGIPRALFHNGGRLAFGPDGMLYATTGDASDGTTAQNPQSLAGKILRMTPEGGIPEDNPFSGSLVYSLGHRNPQGLAWDSAGTLWASEFGQSTWDELNRIEAGGNYGWPVVEGVAGNATYIDPVQQWSPSEASPSGLAARGGTLFLAALRGERLWRIDTGDGVTSTAHFTGAYGRLRATAIAADGSLLLLTNNTAGTGAVERPGDDRLLRVELAEVSADFTDVTTATPFSDEIAWLAGQGISTGWPVDGRREFRPLANVTRDAMAAFLYRSAGSPEFEPPAASPFSDVSVDSSFYKEIAWLADQEISTGWAAPGGAEYRPFDPITRDAMAAFLFRASGESFDTPASSPFIDVTASSPFFREIAWMRDRGMATGTDTATGAEYRPFAPTQRDAMAAFLFRYSIRSS